MKEPLFILWTILGLISGFLLLFLLKKQNRKLDKWEMLLKLFIVVLSFGFGFLVFYIPYQKDLAHWIWLSRFSLLIAGCLCVVIMYKRPWTKRDVLNYEEDSFAIEFVYLIMGSFLATIAFAAAFRVVPNADLNVKITQKLIDLPLFYLIPFSFIKTLDFAGQIPMKVVEKPWVFPLEEINPNDWPWRDLTQINFELRTSLYDEYNLFAWNSKPWIEGPREISLGRLFQLCIQERRQRKDLNTIQDLGDEYGGTPKFCWIFYIKRIWYSPLSWFKKSRYLNPSIPVGKLNVNGNDIIIAKRVPGDGTKAFSLDYSGVVEEDPNKTVLIKR